MIKDSFLLKGHWKKYMACVNNTKIWSFAAVFVVSGEKFINISQLKKNTNQSQLETWYNIKFFGSLY